MLTVSPSRGAPILVVSFVARRRASARRARKLLVLQRIAACGAAIRRYMPPRAAARYAHRHAGFGVARAFPLQ
jgi:hypothetical protein